MKAKYNNVQLSPAGKAKRRSIATLGLGSTLPLSFIASRSSLAQTTYPSKPIRIVVGYAVGGPTDLAARLIAAKMQDSMGQTIIVENKPGAGSNIASAEVARAAPDGYTLLLGTVANATNMTMYKNPGYDTMRDFVAISQVMSAPSILAVNPNLAVQSLKDLIALAKSKPGTLSFGSSGAGGSPHLAGELLQFRADIDLVHVPYKGAAPAMTDVIAGQIHMAFMTALSAVPQIQSGKLKAIAVASAKRVPALPNVPTFSEAGMADFEVSSWSGLYAPAKAPPDIVQKIYQESAKALSHPDVRQKLIGSGADPVGSPPDAFKDYNKAEIEKWATVIRRAKISL
jgi:tripartite-type tricarboxylate transporter receptor subunit TctC